MFKPREIPHFFQGKGMFHFNSVISAVLLTPDKPHTQPTASQPFSSKAHFMFGSELNPRHVKIQTARYQIYVPPKSTNIVEPNPPYQVCMNVDIYQYLISMERH